MKNETQARRVTTQDEEAIWNQYTSEAPEKHVFRTKNAVIR